MKYCKYIGKLILTTTAALAVATGTFPVRGQNLVVDNFNETTNGVSFWAASWGTTPTLTFSTENNGGPAGSGSLMVETPVFTGAGDWEQAIIEKSFSPVLKASLYTSVSVDIKVDPASSPKANGEYGYFELKYGDGGTAYATSLNLPSSATNGWRTITFTVPAAAPDVNVLRFQLGDGDFTGKITYYIDNLRFNAPKTVINRFDDDTEVVGVWTATWGTSPTLEFSATENNGGLATSGSLKVSADYFTPESNGWEQMVVTRNFDPVVGGLTHTAINFDVKVDPSSVLDTDGNYGLFEPKLSSGSAMGGLNLVSTNWVNVTFDFLPNAADLASLLIQNGNGTFQGPITYYLDNLTFIQKVGGPTLALLVGPLDDVERDAVVLNWVLNDGADPINTNSITLAIDGQAAAAAKVTITKTATGATVDFNDTGTLWTSGEHTWSMTFSDTGTPAKNVAAQGGFIVNPYPTEGTFVIEAEDWNYDSGKFNPKKGQADSDVDVMPYLGGAYDTLSAVAGVDYVGDDLNDSDLYRTELDGTGQNAVNVGTSTGRYGLDRGTFEVTSNFRLGWVGNGEWHNYTRTFPTTNYHVWAALSRAGRDPGLLSASLDLVTSPATTSTQTVQPLGAFNGPGTDGWGRNTLVPMKSAGGAFTVVAMSGEQTVRFNVGGGDFDYILFVPTTDPLAPPVINGATITAGNITVTWTGGGTLLRAPSLAGPWTTTGDSDGSFTTSAATGQEYFRVIRP